MMWPRERISGADEVMVRCQLLTCTLLHCTPCALSVTNRHFSSVHFFFTSLPRLFNHLCFFFLFPGRSTESHALLLARARTVLPKDKRT